MMFILFFLPFVFFQDPSVAGFFGVLFLTPYIAIPLYWFVLHQIDTAIKRKRGAGTTVVK